MTVVGFLAYIFVALGCNYTASSVLETKNICMALYHLGHLRKTFFIVCLCDTCE